MRIRPISASTSFAARAAAGLRATALGLVSAGAVLAGGLAPGHAASLTASQILTQFNAVITGSFSSTADVEGRLVTSTLTKGATFYDPRGTAAASAFQAINAINIGSGVSSANVNSSGNVNYVNSNAGKFNLNGGKLKQNAPSFTITDFTDPLNALVKQLAALTPNSTVNSSDLNNFTFKLTPDASGTAVFSLTTAQLAMARNLVFSGTASTIIIDVTGTSFTETGNFNANDTLNRSIIWNFVDATDVSLKSWHGAVLAPNATVTNTSAVEGTVYAANFVGHGELHDYTFAGSLPLAPVPPGGGGSNASTVPEPASFAVLLPALLGLLGVARRRASVGGKATAGAASA